MTAYFQDGAPDGVRVARVDRSQLHRSRHLGFIIAADLA